MRMNISIAFSRWLLFQIVYILLAYQADAQETIVISFEQDNVQVLVNGTSYRNSGVNVTFKYGNDTKSVSRQVSFVNNTRSHVSVKIQKDALYTKEVQGDPEGDFEVNPGATKVLEITWHDIVSAEKDECTVSYKIQGGKILQFVLRRQPQKGVKEDVEQVLESTISREIKSSNPSLTIDSEPAIFQRFEGDYSEQTIEFDIQNNLKDRINLNRQWEPDTLSKYFRLERMTWNGNDYEIFDENSEIRVDSDSYRKMKLTQTDSYYLSNDLEGSILFYQGKDTLEYPITLKAYKTKAQLKLESEIKGLQQKHSKLEEDQNNLRSENRKIQSEKEKLRYVLILGTIPLVVIGFVLGRIKKTGTKERKSQVNGAKGGSRNRSAQKNQAKPRQTVHRNQAGAEQQIKQLQREVESQKNKLAEADNKLSERESDLTEVSNNFHQLEANFKTLSQDKERLEKDLTNYKEDSLVQETIRLATDNPGLKRKHIIAHLKKYEEAYHTKRKADKSPIYGKEAVLACAQKHLQLIETLQKSSNAWYEKAFLQTNNAESLEQLNGSYLKVKNEFEVEYSYFSEYVQQKNPEPKSKIWKVFDVGGLEQTEVGVIKNLSHYFKSEFYPLLSRSIIYLKEIGLLIEEGETGSQGTDTLQITLDQYIREINEALNIKMHPISLQSPLTQEDKKYCKMATAEDLTLYDYASRASFYGAFKVDKGNVKAQLFIGYTDLEDTYHEDLKTIVLMAD